MASKQVRNYFCKMCNARQPAPKNAKCSRDNRKPEASPTGKNPPGESSPVAEDTRLSPDEADQPSA